MAVLLWPHLWYLDIAVLLLAVAVDALLPEPPNALHPVVWIGKAVAFLERLSPKDGAGPQFAYGLAMAILLPIAVGALALVAVLLLAAIHPLAYLVGTALLLKTTFAVSGLHGAAMETWRELGCGIEGARVSLRSLVSRDASTLTQPLIAAAAIESVAENATDSFVAPWIFFALFGLPGAFVYRTVNTLDSMIGYHGRYEYLGKASARLDDALNYVPARLGALLMLLAGFAASGDATRGWRIMRRDHGLTESPNAGWTMSAMSGLLGVALEKPGAYRLGDGLADPEPDDIRRAVGIGKTLAYVGLALAVLFLALLVLIGYLI